MPKILMIVQSNYLSDPRVRREAEALADAGYRIDVVALRGDGEQFKQSVNGVTFYGIALGREHGSVIRYLYEYGVFLVCAAVLAAALHVKNRYDLVQIHNLPDTLVFAAMFPKLAGARLVFDAHEAMPESFRMKFGWTEMSRGFRFAELLERFCMALSDHILTIHEPMRQLFISRRGVRPERISVVMNWPDDRLFRHATEELLVLNGKFDLIYAGTIAERYGLQTAIRALPLLVGEIPGLHLRILGKGDYTAALRQLARELDVEAYVSFQPPVPLVEVPEVYQSSSVGISPQGDSVFGSIYFSTKVAEYLAVGLAAVVARTPIMDRFYNDSQVAFFAPGDYHGFAGCVLRLYREPAYRQSLIENGLMLSKRCNWETEKRAYLSVVAQLASRH